MFFGFSAPRLPIFFKKMASGGVYQIAGDVCGLCEWLARALCLGGAWVVRDRWHWCPKPCPERLAPGAGGGSRSARCCAGAGPLGCGGLACDATVNVAGLAPGLFVFFVCVLCLCSVESLYSICAVEYFRCHEMARALCRIAESGTNIAYNQPELRKTPTTHRKNTKMSSKNRNNCNVRD